MEGVGSRYRDMIEEEELNEWVFVWSKNHISLNQWYSSTHWSNRVKLKRDWGFIFLNLLRKYKPFKLEKYEILLQFNSRLDTSNTIPMIKIFEDFLKKEGVIIDDNKQYAKRIILEPSDELPKFTYKLTLKKVK